MVERLTSEMQLEQAENQQRHKVDYDEKLATLSNDFYVYKANKETKIDTLLSELKGERARLEDELKLADTDGLHVKTLNADAEQKA